LVENEKLSFKILFAIENHGSQQVQFEINIPIENVNHMSTPHQSPFQIILIVNDIDCYN
jgi:hypothetical protein